MRTLSRICFAIASLAVAALASADAARSVWFTDGATVSRISRETGALISLPGDTPVAALAADTVTGVWIVRGNRLQRLLDDLTVAVDVRLADVEAGVSAPALLTGDAEGSGAWLARGKLVSRFAADGTPVAGWSHDETIADVVVGGPDAVWIASAQGVVQYDADGELRRAWRAESPSGAAPVRSLLLDRAGGYLWVVLDQEAIQLDVLRGLEARVSVALPPSVHAAGIDALDGALWVLSATGVTTYDRNARMLDTWSMPPGEPSPLVLAPESGVPIAWAGDGAGLSLLNRQSLQWSRLVPGGSVRGISITPPLLRPALTVERTWPDVSLRFGRTCGLTLCTVDRRNLESMRLHALVDGNDVSAEFDRIPDPESIVSANSSELRLRGSELAAVLVDAFGVASEAVIVDLTGAEATAPGRMRREANALPTVKLTAPANNSTHRAPATINLAATASDADGAIAKVEFLSGTTRLATDAVAPFTHAWSNVAAGTYQLTARATDALGAVTTSSIVTVKVTKPPTARITSPATGARFVMPATITIKASASDPDGTIAKVEFFSNGVLLGKDTSSPYIYNWANPPLGTHTLTVKSTDNLGVATTSSAVSVTVSANLPPVVAISAPLSGMQFVSGTPITITATASDADGTVKKVEFYANDGIGNFRFATDTSAPYSVNTAFGTGTIVLTALATDDKGAITTSPPVTVTLSANQPPVVTLVTPTNEQTITSLAPPDIPLEATAVDADGRIVSLRIYMMPNPSPDDIPVLLAEFTSPPYQAIWPAVPHTDPYGPLYDYFLWAEATDDSGEIGASDPVRVRILQAPQRQIRLLAPGEVGSGGPAVFDAPATIVMRASIVGETGSDSGAMVEFVADGVVVGTLSAPNGADGEYVGVWRDVSAGARNLIARLTDAEGFMVESDPVAIRVAAPNSPPQIAVTAPVHAQVFYNFGYGADIAVSAQASDAEGAVSQLRVFDNGWWFASSAGSPFAGILAANPGLHVLTAQVTDDRGAVAESKPVFVSVAIAPRAPAIVLTSPVPNSSFTTTSPVTMTVDVVSPDRPIAQVDFVDGPYVRATRTSPPYVYTSPLSEGQHVLRAIVHVPFAAPVSSLPVVVNVTGSGAAAPAVALSSPEDGQVFVAPAAIPMAITTDQPARLSSVQYYAGTAEATWSQQTPFAATWNTDKVGTHVLYASAYYDSNSRYVTSLPRTIEVRANEFAELLAPVVGAAVGPDVPVELVGRVGLRQGVARIDFLVDGAVLGSVNVAGSPTVASARLIWNGATVGNHAVEVRGYAADGSFQGMLPVSVQVADVAVAVVEPHPGQNFVAPGDIRITASPVSANGAVAQVEFYGDGILLGSRVAAPWVMVWAGAPAGNHRLHARMRDSGGTWVSSAPVDVSVLATPAITFDSGVDGGSVADDNASVGGSVQAPPNAAVIVNGRRASHDRNGRFFADNVYLKPGVNSVTVVLNTLDAPPIVRTIAISSVGVAPFDVRVDEAEGLAPFATQLRIVNRGNVGFQRIEIDTQDDGVPDLVLTDLAKDEAVVELNYPNPGVYTVAVRVFDADGAVIYSARRKVKALGRDELAYRVVDVYRTMLDRLGAGNASGALRMFVGDVQARYAQVFADLAVPLPEVAAQLGTPIDGVVAEDWAELTLLRPTADGDQLYMLYLIRGGDGLWRVEGM